MKQFGKMFILAAVILASCISAVSAFTIDKYASDPSGPLAPDTPVTVSYDIGLGSTSGTTFPPENDLVMTTELTNPKWAYTLILEGVENPGRTAAAGQTLELTGFELSFRSNIDETVRVTLTGTTPGVSTPSSKKILDIYEINNLGNITTATQVTKTVLVSNVTQTTPTTGKPSMQATEKMAQQNGILEQIGGMFKGLFRM